MTHPTPNPLGPPPKRAMILAAGLGLRMRPLTEKKPKALVEVAGKPLIGHTLDFLAALDLETIIINVHYQPEPLLAYLDQHPLGPRIKISDERAEILETGGGVKNVLEAFKEEPFFVANCDAFFAAGGENPFQKLAGAFAGDGAWLLLSRMENAIGYEGRGDFFLKPDGALERREDRNTAPYIFTGLQILSPGLFEGIEDAKFSLNKVYDRALSMNCLKGLAAKDPWFHIGTPDALLEAEAKIGGGS